MVKAKKDVNLPSLKKKSPVPPWKWVFCKGTLAQLVEHRTENPGVPGSIPGGTTLSESLLSFLGGFFYAVRNFSSTFRPSDFQTFNLPKAKTLTSFQLVVSNGFTVFRSPFSVHFSLLNLLTFRPSDLRLSDCPTI